MSDSEDKKAVGEIPSWQRDSSEAKAPATPEPQDQLQVARRFLENDVVKNAPKEEKAEFLRTKGIGEDDIQKLLAEDKPKSKTESTTTTTSPAAEASTTPRSTVSPEPPSQSDRPPVVTYPEFLYKAERPPPLITASAIFTTLSSFAGLATLLYGTSNFLIAPMVESLTAARHELHDMAGERLDSLNKLLEQTVSEIPPTASKWTSHRDAHTGNDDSSSDEDSQADDPTEMFHRDVGTQTSLPPPPPPNVSSLSPALPPPDFLSRTAAGAAPGGEAESLSGSQSAHLASLNQRLASLRDDIKSQSSDLDDVKALIDVFRDDLDEMTFGTGSEMAGSGFDVFGKKGSYAGSQGAKKGEDDEIKKVRDGIRRVKGVLLSTRNFPASVR